MLGNIKEQLDCYDEDAEKVNNIASLSETRWTVRAICFSDQIMESMAAYTSQ